MEGGRLGFLVLAGALGLGCGRSVIAGDATNHDASQDGQGASPLCPSGAGPDPTQVVLAALSKGELILVRADGTRTVVERAGARIWRAGDFLAASSYAGGRFDIVLVDRGGTLRWRHSREFEQDIEPGALWVNGRGGASIGLPSPLSPRGVAILPDGTARDLPLYPRGPPDESGWIPVEDSEPNDGQWGFIHAQTGELRLARVPLPGNGYPTLAGGQRVYLGNDGDHLAVIVATPEGDESFPLRAIDVTRAYAQATDTGAVVVERGLPRAVLRANPWRLIEVAPLTIEARREAFCWTDGNRGLVTVDGVPRWLLDLETAAVSEVAPLVPAWEGRRFPVPVQFNGRWALGDVVWRVDLTTGESLRVDLKGLAPLHVFEPCNAGPPVLLDDGSIALGLRDNVLGGAYVGQPGQAPWTSIGRPVAGITKMEVSRVASTWVLASRYESTFCPEQPLQPAPASEQALLGDSVQVVLPGADAPVVFQGHKAAELSLHSSGLCATERGIVHDLVTGARTELPPLDPEPRFGGRLVWW